MGSLKAYMAQKDCKWQFVEPSNYRVATLERVIQISKNHLISWLYTTDAHCPVKLSDHLTTQAVLIVNVLRASHINRRPDKDVYIYDHSISSKFLLTVITYSMVQWHESRITHQLPNIVAVQFPGTAERFLLTGPTFKSSWYQLLFGVPAPQTFFGEK